MNGSVFMRSVVVRSGLPVLMGVLVVVSVSRLATPLRERGRLERLLEERVYARRLKEFFAPLHAELQTAERVGDWPELALPPRQRLDREAVRLLADRFRRLAREHQFELEEVLLQVVTEGDQRLLKVNLPLKGRYAGLGLFLNEVIRQPSLESVSRVSVSQNNGDERMDIEIRLLAE